MNKKAPFICFYACCLGLTNLKGNQMIIFDLGGVILQEAEVNLNRAITQEWNIDKTQSIPRIFNRMFEFINLLYERDCKKQWIIGTITPEEIIQKIKDHIDKAEFSSFFKTDFEKNLIKFGSEIILLPNKLTEFTDLYVEGYEFVKKCKVKNIRISILSNWDPLSFKLIQVKFKDLFSLFDAKDLYIPATIGFIKPETEIYEYILKNANADPKKTFFVDDSSLNVAGATKVGIKSVLHKGNWHETENELRAHGLKL
jgi:FMN phosphatase YigB (HAD superfamily)